MNFLANFFSNFMVNLGGSASTMCTMIFFEPEMPKSLREE